MAAPTAYTLEVAFSTDPFAVTPTWTDVSAHLISATIRRGRNRELDRIEGSSATFVLDNNDRRFDPSYAGTLVNLFENPSAELSLGSYWINENRVSVARVAGQAYSGSYSCEATVSATGTLPQVGFRDVAGNRIAVTASAVYSFSVWAKMRSDYGVRNANFRVIFYDSGGASVSDTSAGIAALSTSYQRFTYSVSAPATAATARILFQFHDGTATIGEIYDADAVQVEQAASASTYTDGSLDNCRWAGTAHASTSYRGAPYYPYVIPMRKVRLSVTHAGSTRYVFTGYVDGWPQSWDLPNYTEAPVTASCGLKVCSLFNLSSSLTSAASGTQIGSVLDQVGWPAADRVIDTGQSTVQALTVAAGDEVPALSRIQDIADTELGIFFIDGQGRAVFHDRHKRLKTPYTVSNGTFGDDPATEIPYAYLRPDYDEQELKNDVRLTPAGGSTQSWSDSASQASYGKRTYTKATIHQTASEALDQAYFIVSRYKDPALRFNAIRLEPLDSSSVWAQVLDRELGDRVTVTRRPPGGGTVTQDCHIESVQHEVGSGLLGWQTTWGLSSADETTYWTLGDSVNGLLGTSTSLAY